MNIKLFFIFFFLFVSQMILPSSIGLSLEYEGDLKGNGNVSGAMSCGYDIHNIRFQTTFNIDDNLNVSPSLEAISLHSAQKTNSLSALTEAEVALINTAAHLGLFSYNKQAERMERDLVAESKALERCQAQAQRAGDTIDKEKRKITELIKSAKNTTEQSNSTKVESDIFSTCAHSIDLLVEKCGSRKLAEWLSVNSLFFAEKEVLVSNTITVTGLAFICIALYQLYNTLTTNKKHLSNIANNHKNEPIKQVSLNE